MKSTELIQPTAIQTPIAVSGDKVIPNQTATNIDTSSIAAGFLPITQQPLDTGGQAPERTDFNGMFYLATDQRVFLQNGGFITYDTDVVNKIGGYPQNAILGYMDSNGNFGLVRSLIDNNAYNFVKTPSYINNTYWAYVHINNTDSDISKLNSSISTTNTNLTSLSNSVVKLTGNQTISNTKTFTGAVVVPDSAAAGSPINTKAINKSSRGYLKMGNGVIIQWGYVDEMANGTSKTVTFPTPFSYYYSYSIGGSASYYQSAGNKGSTWRAYELTSSNFKIQSSFEQDSGQVIWWIAVGY